MTPATARLFRTMILCALPACVRPETLLVAELVEEAKQAISMPSGTAIAVVEGDAVIFEGYFGYANVSERRAVTGDTLFYIASLTKPFFATATLLAEHRGDIDTGSSLRTLFPELVFENIDPAAVDVRQLLSHSMGFDNELLEWTTAYTGLHDRAVRYGLAASSAPDGNRRVGEFSYSNVGYNILSLWFESFYARPWQQTLDELVFEPLDMARSTAIVSEARRNEWYVALPYSYKVANGESPIYLTKTDDTMHAAGGIVSTARDVARFLSAHINGGAIDGTQVLPASVIEKAQQAVVSTGPDGGAYAWGWFVDDYDGNAIRYHTGGYPGASAKMSFMPGRKIGVVVLHNEGGLKANVLNDMITDVVYGELLGSRRDDVRDRFADELGDLVALVAEAEAKLVADAKTRAATAWNLKHRKEAYTGSYSHPLGGTITVSLRRAGDFDLEWGRLKSPGSAHPDADSMWHQFKPGSFRPLRFRTDTAGVNSLKIAGTLFYKDAAGGPRQSAADQKPAS